MREDLLEVILLATETETESTDENLTGWTISSLDKESIVIDLELTRPLLVSQGDKPDQLLIKLNFSIFKDIYGESLPETILKIE